MVRLRRQPTLDMARHECCHAAFASACTLRVTAVHLTPEPATHVHYNARIDRGRLPQYWQASAPETTRRVIEAVGVILAPSVVDPEGSPLRAFREDVDLLREWTRAWNRLRIGSGRTTVEPWERLEERARRAVERWGSTADAWIALTTLAETLVQARAFTEKQWLTLWRSPVARHLRVEIRGA